MCYGKSDCRKEVFSVNKTLKYLLPAAGAAALGLGAAAWLIAPGRASKRAKAPFTGRNYAHRGLHKVDKTVPENSLTAFRLAVENGYGMELDVQLSSDDEVVVFHDDTLDRVCGVEGEVDDRSWDELKKLPLCGTDERMPLFSEVLNAVGGRTPIIIELKARRKNRLLCEKTLALIDRYGGPVCVESFDPYIVRWFRFHAPDILRGQLSSQYEDLEPDVGRFRAFCRSHLLTNFLSRPQFIAYRIGKKPLTVRLCEAMGAMRVLWTSHDWKSESEADAVIFEFYRPRRKFK